MMYHIKGYQPEPGMGAAGFSIQLWPEWKRAVAERKLTQADCNRAIENMGRSWLDGHGYSRILDNEPLYKPRDVRVSWGEWGPEHITVPGNACGLDIDRGNIWAPHPDGVVLSPHNVDSVAQASLLLTVFLFFADTLVLDQQVKEFEKKGVAS